MSDKQIDGQKLSKQLYTELEQFASVCDKTKRIAVIVASSDRAAGRWVKNKQQKAADLGVKLDILNFDQQVSKADLLDAITVLNQDERIAGVVVQLPLFDHLKDDQSTILTAILPTKDIDGLTPFNQGGIATGRSHFVSATALACMQALHSVHSSLRGKNVLIVNHSVLIGRPLANLLLNEGATVTIAHEDTVKLQDLMLQSEIVVSATGRGGLFDHSYISQNATVIDVTTASRNDGQKLVGDFVADQRFVDKVGSYTPVPGGIGPLTIACLMQNIITALQTNG